MTPIFFNSSSNNYPPYPNELHREDHLNNHQFLSPNSQASSSLIPLTTHMFLNSNIHDQHEVFDRELQPPQHQHEGDNFGSQLYNDQRIENNNEKSDKFPTWNKIVINNLNNDQNQMKWMSSKMRIMLKMKKSDPVNLKFYSSSAREVTKLEDHKPPTLPMEETDNSSNITSSNNNIPIRVCSDCNTTKTPLWRSGPCGPKSLCNACGIRQRKARRAMADVFTNQCIIAPLKVTKTQHKDHKKSKNGHVTKYKKRQFSKQIATTTTTTTTTTITTTTTPSPSPLPSPSPSPSPSMSPSSSSPARKNCVEEFLVNLSKNLSCYRVFPQDEKEAAILLMALSCGYAHET